MLEDSISNAIVKEAYAKAVAHPDADLSISNWLVFIIVSVIFTLALVGAFYITRSIYLAIRKYKHGARSKINALIVVLIFIPLLVCR